MRSRTPAFGSVTAAFHLQRTAPASTVIHSEAVASAGQVLNSHRQAILEKICSTPRSVMVGNCLHPCWSALRWQNDTEYNAVVRTHLSRSADVSATIGRAESRSRSASRVNCRRRGVPGLRGTGDKLRDPSGISYLPRVGCLPEGCSRACVNDFKTAGVAVGSRQLGFNPIDISAAGICRSQNVDEVRSGATKLDE
jgi:hypothetical protein